MEYKKDNTTELIKKSNILLENRKNISITGVFEVLSFDEEKVTLNTVLKKLEIIGNNLKISKLDLKNGEISITGNINECKYLDDKKFKGDKNKLGIVKKILGKNKWLT